MRPVQPTASRQPRLQSPHERVGFGGSSLILEEALKANLARLKQDVPEYQKDTRFEERIVLGLKDLQDFVNTSGRFKKYRPVNVIRSFTELTPRIQHLVVAFLLGMQPGELKALEKAKKLGPPEEGADMLLEYFTLEAIRDKIFTDKNIDHRTRLLDRGHAAQQDFQQVLGTVANALPSKVVDRFQALTQISDRKRAMYLLALVQFKFANFRQDAMLKQEKKVPILKDTRLRMLREAWELVEDQPVMHKIPIMLRALAYTYLKVLPTRWLRDPVVRFERHALQAQVQFEELMDLVYQKQAWRQELHYTYPKRSQSERKQLIKPFEALMEGYFLKNKACSNPNDTVRVSSDEVQNTKPLDVNL